MEYWVIFPDGQKFGPASVDLLNTWAGENRINPDSDLENAATGERIKARDLPGLNFPQATPQPDPGQPVFQQPQQPQQPVQTQEPQNPYGQQQQPGMHGGMGAPGVGQQPGGEVYNPYQNPYPRGGAPQYAGDDGSSDLTKSYVFSVLGLLCCVFFVIGGFVFAQKAEEKGNPGAKTARTVAIVVSALAVIGVIVQIAMFASSGF